MKSIDNPIFRILFLIPLLGVSIISPLTKADSATDNKPAADSGTIPSGQFKLNYRIEGAGPPALVIGFPDYYARTFSKNLRSHLRLIFTDHRGSAASPGQVDVSSEFALEKLTKDVELIRTSLHLGRIAVIGHGGHAFLALEYAKRYPDNVSHVIMIGIPNLNTPNSEAMQQNWLKLASPQRKAILEENNREMSKAQMGQLPPSEYWIQMYVHEAPRIWYDPHFDAVPLWEGVDLNLEMIDYVWGTLFSAIDVPERLAHLERPVFLAQGRYDFSAAPTDFWDPVKKRCPHLTVQVFEKSGHTPQYEEAEAFDKALLAWMNK